MGQTDTVLDDRPTGPITPPDRDSVAGLSTESGSQPTIVSVSDIHGFLSGAREALLTLSDHPEYDPLVTTDPVRRLQWAGNDYVLVLNGDLIDRGPHSDRVFEMAARLMEQAPAGRVRVVFGNHEMGLFAPDRFGWEGRYSVDQSEARRKRFLDRIIEGHVVAAYEGYNVRYAHAGRPNGYEVTELNESLIAAAETVRGAVGRPHDAAVQRATIDEYSEVLGLSGRTGRGRDAGVAWLDFEYMPPDAPPQVVGHTRHDKPVRNGNVICENVLRNNRREDGGEAVVIEDPDGLSALVRAEDGSVRERTFSLPETVERTH